MQLKFEQLASHLARGLQPLYTLCGDEPLQQQEAADAIRAAARAAGHAEREVFTVSGAHFDWSMVLGAASEMSLFSAGRIIEIRIPSGKPAKEGSQALQDYCERLPEGVVTLVSLPRPDTTTARSAWFAALEQRGVMLRLDPVERGALPAWLAQRLAAQGQHVRDGQEGQRTLAFFADRVEGNLLAAQQEIGKLGLLYPPGELGLEEVEAAVLNVARYDVRQFCAAVLGGHVPRALRMLEGLRAEGESPVSVLWQLSDDLRALKRVRESLSQGQPLPMALSAARVWGPRQRIVEACISRLSAKALSRLLIAAGACDGIVKGLRRPDWPQDPWDAVQRLALMTLHFTRATPPGGRTRPPLVLVP